MIRISPPFAVRAWLFAIVAAMTPVPAIAQSDPKAKAPISPMTPAPTPTLSIPSLDANDLSSELRSLISRFATDQAALARYHRLDGFSVDRDRKRALAKTWLQALDGLDFDKLSRDGQMDCVLFRNQLRYELRTLDLEAANDQEFAALTPFASTIWDLADKRRRVEPIVPQQAADTLHALAKQTNALSDDLEKESEKAKASDSNSDSKGRASGSKIKKTAAMRAARRVFALQRDLDEWHKFYEGYDPQFTWWTKSPYAQANQALGRYASAIRRHLAGVSDQDRDAIVGDPIGRDGLRSELEREMIPYSPDELVKIADREFAWCEAEARKAARDLGFGDDWRKAVEHVKTKHVLPGKQPEMVRDLAREAIRFLDERDLVTIPDLCREIWRMEMMSPERQRVNPFFLGGEAIIVSFPTDTMTHEEKLMSLRGNNIHFSRATVHHELIPGHHLQGFMTDRYRPHRQLFRTPFWVEGWALHWEMLLWDLNFPKSAEDRAGMLFWRMHRCARIIFSLRFHLETMTPEQAIDFLVERVGHERNNATAEIRRSFSGDYSPLYQCAYMLGGMQIRALRKELVESGQMTDRQFHDAVLKQNAIPIELIRAALTNAPLKRDAAASWRFADPIN